MEINMLLTGKKSVFPSLLLQGLAMLLQCIDPCVGQNVTLSTKSDVIVFVGERVTLLCSVSDIPTDETPSFKITYENGTEITSAEIGSSNIPTVQSVQIDVRRTENFFCTVDWEGFKAVANLSISPFPTQLTHCESNYTIGIIVGQTLTLVCASSTNRTFSLAWSSSDSGSVSSNVMNARGMTFVNTINIQPTEIQNGTIFTCKRLMRQSEQGQCSVGPIYVYNELRVFIDPVMPANPRKVHPGESRKYVCSSSPSSSIRWIVPDGLEASGVELSEVANNVINVTVAADSTFTGEVELNCSANFLDVVTFETVTVEIVKRTTTPTNIPTSSVNETNAPADMALFIAIGTVGGIVAILLIIAIFVLICLNCKSNKAATVKPESKNPADFTDREYAVPPFGSGQPDEVLVRVESHPSATGEDGELFYSEINREGGGKKIVKSDSGALLPPTTTIKAAETTASQHKGQDNGGYTSTRGEEAESNFEEEEYSMIDRNRASVVYSAPYKKTSVSSSRSDAQRDNKQEEDSVAATPTYSAVKKGPRRVVIEEESIDEEYWDYQQ